MGVAGAGAGAGAEVLDACGLGKGGGAAFFFFSDRDKVPARTGVMGCTAVPPGSFGGGAFFDLCRSDSELVLRLKGGGESSSIRPFSSMCVIGIVQSA